MQHSQMSLRSDRTIIVKLVLPLWQEQMIMSARGMKWKGYRNCFEEHDEYVNIHGHDRNASVNQYLATNQPTLTNANDTWHASKGVKKEMKKIAYGHKKLKGIAWHPRLHQSIPILTTPWRNAKDPQKNWENYYTTLWSITGISMRAVQQSRCVKLIPIMSLQNK